MKAPGQEDSRATSLYHAIRPYLEQLLQQAPRFGEITFTATIHENQIGKISIGYKVTMPMSKPAGVCSHE